MRRLSALGRNWRVGHGLLQVRSASTASEVLAKFFPQKGFKSHEEWYRFSIEKPDEFWGQVGRSQLQWFKDFNSVMQCDMHKADFKWYLGGKLNASVNCIDRHAELNPDRTALIWEKDEPGQQVSVSYAELSRMTGQIANALKRHGGVKKGDVVAIYMPNSPLAVATMLACARIGAVHNVIFAGFSAEAIATRVHDSNAVAIVTSDSSVRGGNVIRLKATVDQAMKDCPTVKSVFVAKRTGENVQMKANEMFLQEVMETESPECPPEYMDSEDQLFLLYTSGSTGKPKGLVHTTAGYLNFAQLTQKVAFNYEPGDIFGCVADIGWITGHSYVIYGPLLNGATSVLFESTPTYPDPGRYWETVQRLKINQFYGAPTALRLLMKSENEYVTKYDRSSLKTLGSVGEPLNHEAWEWFYELVGEKRCDLVDTWWQSETGGITIAPRPAEVGSEIIPGKPMRPMFGIEPVLVNEKGSELSGNNIDGALCLKRAWPGIARSIGGDHQRFYDTYFKQYPGLFFTGDGAHKDEKGYWQITGRMDDVINVTGHRLGTAEVEDAMDEHPSIAEAAVVGFPHDLKGEGVYAYVILKDNAKHEDREKLIQELKKMVRAKISGFAVPEHVQFCSGLPKTRSGKIMRRILRKVAADRFDELGDISTLADPSVVDEIIRNHKKLERNEKY